MDFKSILYEKDNQIATITKNNPPQYGMSLEVLVEMTEALDDASNDENISVIFELLQILTVKFE